MQDRLYQVMQLNTRPEIDDAKFKISTLVDRPTFIPEHIDITGEVDKLLHKISSAEDRMAAMRRHYGKKEGRLFGIRDLKSFEKFFCKISFEKKVYFCTFGLEVLILLTLGWTTFRDTF